MVLATELARLRAESGWSLRELADKVGWDHSQLHGLERGRTLGGPEVIEALDTVYGTKPLLMRLWEIAKQQVVFRDKYVRYMELEAEASVIEHYAGSFLHGMFQTEAYARELLWSTPHLPSQILELEEQLASRMSRHELLLSETPPHLRAIIDEAVLRRPLLDAGEWRGQLAHIAEMASQPHVTVQVLPYSVGLHDLLGGLVTLLRCPDGSTAVWVESSKSGELFEDAREVEQLRLSYDALRDVALSPQDSVAFIEQVMEDSAPCDPPAST
ncbi:helix-turn-helix transcriptional regulator [Streptomyces sp. DT2A-34]|uniref:helix-turn-helix domain-containing protein n=1 Tax=Streptomyces sp. DT2A-34 TaxID=3051182 RepID=UPI00265B8149|nr:helix-turn-helix transcriptional regulator [Streptomyces sp. DT2A-34]MDO0913924.1 helix-turn-helix transcriptional regulator [Streptomyces sp. DT2A-34]